MATVTVASLVNKAQIILQDTTDSGVRWPELELLGWLNDGYLEIVLARPDANSSYGTFSCEAGSRQQLDRPGGGFENALSLLDVIANKAPGSNKGAIRQIDRSILDDQRRTWHAESQVLDLEHWMHDPRIPRCFHLYPPAASGAQIEVVYSYAPTAHTAVSGVINMVDSYAPALLDYMLYRAYSKDAEYTANANRAMGHYQAMQNSLGIGAKAAAAASPMDIPTMVNPNQPT